MKLPRLLRDERGATAIQVALGMGVMFGASGLAIDLGRAMHLETEMQQAADAAALAGATELDGGDDARQRATTAATGALGSSNVQTFATDTGGSLIAVSQVTFLSQLDPDMPASNDLEARFIQVQVTARESAPLLMPVLTGKDAPLRIGAKATAGFTRVACNIPPLMVCNPFEPAGATTETPFDSFPGQQILIKSHSGGNGGQWAPGTFGLLDAPDGTQSTQQLSIWLAKGASPGCYSTKLGIRPGQADAVRTALNTRFDMYENPFFGGNNDKRNPDYRPAVNVTKGMDNSGSDACKPAAPTSSKPAMALPRDSCIKAGTCRFGGGDGDIAGYWNVNHGGSPPAGVTTRYQAYRWEIDNTQIPDPPPNGTTVEQGDSRIKSCYKGPTPTDSPDRRVLIFAVVNCGLHGIHGNADDIRPVAFVKSFLTEPVSTASDIYLETIEVARPETNNSVMHDVIQLYR